MEKPGFRGVPLLGLPVCRVIGEEGASLSCADRVSLSCRAPGDKSNSTREPCANPVCKVLGISDRCLYNFDVSTEMLCSYQA